MFPRPQHLPTFLGSPSHHDTEQPKNAQQNHHDDSGSGRRGQLNRAMCDGIRRGGGGRTVRPYKHTHARTRRLKGSWERVGLLARQGFENNSNSINVWKK